MASETTERMTASLKKVAAVLNDNGIPFALGGGLACWAYGAPESNHDIDLMVRKEDAERAQLALAEAGFRPERPPEGWLLKVYDGDVLVDLIYEPVGVPITDDVLSRTVEREVAAMRLRVLGLEDIMVSRLLAFSEHHFDVVSALAVARAVREQVNWQDVRDRTTHSPFACAFLLLLERLNIIPPARSRPATESG